MRYGAMQNEAGGGGGKDIPSPSVERLVARLAERRADLESWFDQRYTIQNIIRDSVGPDTFRALRRNGEVRPSLVYHAWCEKRISSSGGQFLAELDTNTTQAQYDTWLEALSNDFRHYYDLQIAEGQGSSQPISHGVRTKIPDLLMKRLMLWGDLPDRIRHRLVWFLHLPLDSSIMGALAEWRAYLEEILARHKRKHSLVPLLQALLKPG